MKMHMTRRHALASATAGLTTAIATTAAAAVPSKFPHVPMLVQRSEEANAALMQGDVGRYSQLVPLAADFTLMSPFGGTPSRGADYTPERMQSMGRLFRNGTLRQEVVHTYATEDMAVLAVIEHAHVEVGGLPAQDWSLRVTLVYRRQGDAWELVHRHADPLAGGISLQESAALARRPVANR